VAEKERRLHADAEAACGRAEERGAVGEGVCDVLAARGDRQQRAANKQASAAYFVTDVGASLGTGEQERLLELAAVRSGEQRKAVTVNKQITWARLRCDDCRQAPLHRCIPTPHNEESWYTTKR
jgi:hypothetical protein